MERGLYIAAAGMLSEWVRQDQLSNDLANANTAGYKADRSTQRDFAQYLMHNTRTGEQVGKIGQGPLIGAQVTDLSVQPLKDTGDPLDLGIAGYGFFGVQTADGPRFTRNGQFSASNDGTLVDQLGNTVLGADGDPVRVNADGTVDASAVGVFHVATPVKVGQNYFTGTADTTTANMGEVRTGALESSGVDAGRVMIDMMASLRAFEAGQKTISTIDSTLEKAASQVGNLGG